MPAMPEGFQPPEGFDPSNLPADGNRVRPSRAGVAGDQPAGVPGGGGMIGGMPGGGGMFGGMIGGADYLTSVGLKTNENSPDYSGLFDLLQVLNTDPSTTSTQQLEQVMDVDEFLRYLAVSTVLVHLDNYTGMGHNYYLYELDGRFAIIPWDLNMAFGGFNSGLDRDGIMSFLIDEPVAGVMDEYPLVDQLMSKPGYVETYHEYLQKLVDGPFSVVVMERRIKQIADLIRPYVQADDKKFFSTEAFEQSLVQDVAAPGGNIGGMGSTSFGLLAFVQERVASHQSTAYGRKPQPLGRRHRERWNQRDGRDGRDGRHNRGGR